VISEDLKTLARILADWSAPAPGVMLYVYGSRVRGDHRPDSDVDVCIEWGAVGDHDVDWWIANNREQFSGINTKLPGRLQILEASDPLRFQIIAAPRAYELRNIRCMLLPPKP
jgi:hypothetical protein